ncbi:MAG TPA: hypothetical protein PLN91_14720 [Rhodanobacteraceae bacterium]|nr:hypothetical protein [Rhodanobacteraceae bacterium]
MTETPYYAVFLFPQALEALGDPIRPYVTDGPGGPHIVCAEVDSSGALFGMTLAGKDANGKPLELEIMLPHAMVKLVMSVHGEHAIGFS